MSISFLTRSAVAVASLAIGSAVLAAAPASAAGSTDVTRGEILEAYASRGFLAEPTDADLLLVQKVCGDAVPSDDYYSMTPNQTSSGVDGVLVQAYVPGEGEAPPTFCTFAAFAPDEAAATMSGTATISPSQLTLNATAADATYTLSGDAYVTEPITDEEFIFSASVSASGDVVKTLAATTTKTRVSTPKSTQVKKAAFRTYQRSVSKAKAAYKKSVAKAGTSSGKKKAARATYKARTKAAKAKLHIAWSSDKKTVVTVTPNTSRTPFTFDASNNNGCGRSARC